MSTQDVIYALNKSKYDWKRDKRHFKHDGIIPWTRCIHCGKKIETESLQYCAKCDALFMFKQASEKISINVT